MPTVDQITHAHFVVDILDPETGQPIVLGGGVGLSLTTFRAFLAAMRDSTSWLDNISEGVVESGGAALSETTGFEVTKGVGTFEVAPGGAVIEYATDPTAQAFFVYSAEAVDLFAEFAPPDPTDPRIDLTILQVTDTATGEAELQVIEGVPDPDPEVPEVPPNALGLWRVEIPAGETDPTGWDVTQGFTVVQAIGNDFQEQIIALAASVVSLQDEINTEHVSVDQEVTDTTLFTHPELGHNLTADWQWHFRMFVFLLNDGSDEGVKFAITGNHALDTFGLKAQITIYDDTLGTIAATGRVTAFGQAVGAALSAGENHAVIEGVVDISPTDNTNIQLQFAQNATGAGAGVHVQTNSEATFTRLAQSAT